MVFMNDNLPCLDLLEATPAILRGLMSEISEEDAEITLSQMRHEWALHDLGHIRQIAELVRARKYLAGAGSLDEEYKLKP
jgi:hypothetical protein